MIQNLNPQSFREYGQTTPYHTQPSHYVNHHSISLTPEQSAIYQAVAPTWIQCESGMTILSVSQDNQSYRDFYLDKPVQVRSGIWFSLTAFRAAASVQMSAYSLPRPVQTLANSDTFQVRQSLRIESLYTFFYQEKEQGFFFPGEAHPMLELVYTDQGSFHSVADGQDLLLSQGEMVLYGPNQWHMQYADSGMAPRFITLCFETSQYDFSVLFNKKIHPSQSAVSLLKQMLREQEQPDAYSQDMILSLLTTLLLTLLRQAGCEATVLKPAATLNGENEIIRRVQQYVADHVCQKLTVPILAKSCKVSPSYMTALFQKHLQISPGEYIRRIKLQYSKQLIREGNLNITQIAEALEYSTIHHFSRQFKEKFGITPSEYAKSVK